MGKTLRKKLNLLVSIARWLRLQIVKAIAIRSTQTSTHERSHHTVLIKSNEMILVLTFLLFQPSPRPQVKAGRRGAAFKNVRYSDVQTKLGDVIGELEENIENAAQLYAIH